MKTRTEKQLQQNIRIMLITFVTLLILSGITAFPLEWGLSIFADFLKSGQSKFTTL